MENNWEEFKQGPAKRGALHVTLDPKGNILIGASAVDQMGKPDAAIMLFDREKGLVGLRPTHPKTLNAFPLNTMPWGRHRVVRANRFFRHYGLRVNERMVFTECRIEDSVLVLNIQRLQPLKAVIKVKEVAGDE